MKNEEYMADFCLVSRRTLTAYQYQIFKYHYLLGADWKLCCRKLKTDRGTFFHEVYRIQQKLGRTFRELQPYALFPLDEYFNGALRNSESDENTAYTVDSKAAASTKTVLKFPVKKAA